MGIGVKKRDVQKHAILINGDLQSMLSEQHTENMRILDTFLSRHGYHVTKVGGSEISRDKLTRLVEGVRQKMDGDDELFLYVTGHGELRGGEECASVDGVESLPLRWIDAATRSLNYKERTVWLDGCFSGGALRYFSEDPKTLFVSAGSRSEAVICSLFTRPAFEKGKDLNGDGVISFGERFVAGAENIRAQRETFSPIYFAGRHYEDNGVTKGDAKPRFEAGVVSVSNAESLKKELTRLQPGEVAVVDFSATWCGPCQAYKPEFEKMALEDGGKYLWIRAEGEGDPWGEWKVSRYPTVKIFHVGDPAGYAVDHRENPLSEIPASLEDGSARAKRLVENILDRMVDGLVPEKEKAAKEMAGLMDERKIGGEDFLRFWNEKPSARVGLGMALGKSFIFQREDARQTLDLIVKVVLKEPDEWVRKAAVEAIPEPLWNTSTRTPETWVDMAHLVLWAHLLTDPSIHVRDAVAKKLLSHSLRDEQRESWIQIVGDEIHSGHLGPIHAMQLLMKYHDASPLQVRGYVFDFLEHSDWLVRREAAAIIEMYSARFHSGIPDRQKFVERLRNLVRSDPVEEVRLSAASALVGGLGDKFVPAVPLLVSAMKKSGSETFLKMQMNGEEVTEEERVLFSRNGEEEICIRSLESMGPLAKGAVPDLIEEMQLFPRDSGKILAILLAILAIDQPGFPGHLNTIWMESEETLVDDFVLDQAEKLEGDGIELLEGFLKEKALNSKAALGSPSASELKWRLGDLRGQLKDRLMQMRAAPLGK